MSSPLLGSVYGPADPEPPTVAPPDGPAIYRSAPAASPRTLLDVLDATAARHPDAVALDTGDTRLDYRSLCAPSPSGGHGRWSGAGSGPVTGSCGWPSPDRAASSTTECTYAAPAPCTPCGSPSTATRGSSRCCAAGTTRTAAGAAIPRRSWPTPRRSPTGPYGRCCADGSPSHGCRRSRQGRPTEPDPRRSRRPVDSTWRRDDRHGPPATRTMERESVRIGRSRMDAPRTDGTPGTDTPRMAAPLPLFGWLRPVPPWSPSPMH